MSIPAEDAEIIDIIVAAYFSHRITGDPLWLILIDAPGSGKTELLRSFRSRSDAYFLSALTEKALVSGYRVDGTDPSLLPQFDGKVVFIKDLAPLISMRRDERNAIIGIFRDIYDGFSDHGRGNIGKFGYDSRFSLITAGTASVDQADFLQADLGERFLKVRARGNGNEAKVRRAIHNTGKDTSMREEISHSIRRFLDSLPATVNAFGLHPAIEERLGTIAHFTATARSDVARDRKGDLQYHPKAECGTRLGKELCKLLVSLAVIRGHSFADESDLKTVLRVAEDCLPPNRLLVWNALQTPARTATIEDLTNLPNTTTRRVLDDLRVLKLATLTNAADPNAREWSRVDGWLEGV
jgi:hypothetical protein